MYTTEAVKTGLPVPQQTLKMDASEIVEYLKIHVRMKTVAGSGRFEEVPANKVTAFLKATFDAYSDPADWKAPFYAQFPQHKEWLKAAIIWYHGAKATETFIGVRSPGYQCW